MTYTVLTFLLAMSEEFLLTGKFGESTKSVLRMRLRRSRRSLVQQVSGQRPTCYAMICDGRRVIRYAGQVWRGDHTYEVYLTSTYITLSTAPRCQRERFWGWANGVHGRRRPRGS